MQEGHTLLAYTALTHELVKVPLLANVPLHILQVEAALDRATMLMGKHE